MNHTIYQQGAAHPLAALPPSASDLEDLALLPLPVVRRLTGRSASSIYGMVATERFPAPVRYGTRCSRWQAGTVRAWLIEQAQDGAQQDLVAARVKAKATKASHAAQTPAARAKMIATKASNTAARNAQLVGA